MNQPSSKLIMGLGIVLCVVFVIGAIGMFTNNLLGANRASVSTTSVSSSGAASMENPSSPINQSTMAVDSSAKSSTPYIGMPTPIMPGQTSLSTDRQLIKTANMSVIVDDLRKQSSALEAKAKDLGGFATSSSVTTLGDGAEQAYINLRVPVTKLDALIQSVRAIALRVVDEQTSSDDTTDQLVDIDARLKSLHQADDQYGEILKSATNVDDILKITQARTDIRTQIEQLAAQEQSLKNQVSFSTVTVSMSTETGLPSQAVWRPSQQVKLAWQALVKGFADTGNVLIVGVIMIPLIALWLGLLWFFGRLGWKFIGWIRTRLFNN